MKKEHQVYKFQIFTLNCPEGHSLTVRGIGSLTFDGGHHLEVAGSILTAGK